MELLSLSLRTEGGSSEIDAPILYKVLYNRDDLSSIIEVLSSVPS